MHSVWSCYMFGACSINLGEGKDRLAQHDRMWRARLEERSETWCHLKHVVITALGFIASSNKQHLSWCDLPSSDLECLELCCWRQGPHPWHMGMFSALQSRKLPRTNILCFAHRISKRNWDKRPWVHPCVRGISVRESEIQNGTTAFQNCKLQWHR